MNLYEIGLEIFRCVDEETGEILNDELLKLLEQEEKRTLNRLGLYVKNLEASNKAIKEEVDRLNKRKKANETKIDNLKEYIKGYLNGRKFKSDLVTMSYRKSEKLEIGENFIDWAERNRNDLLKYEQPTPDKTKIKECLKLGEEIKHCTLKVNNNFQIK